MTATLERTVHLQAKTVADGSLEIGEPDKPILLLDVDGVINAAQPYPDVWERWQQTCLGNSLTIVWAEEVRQCLLDWHRLAEIRWLTTWGGQAPMYIAPALDLPEWPVEERFHHRMKGMHDWWKWNHVSEISTNWPERLIAWVDDDIKWVSQREHNVEMRHALRRNVVAYSPDSYTGLNRQNCEAITKVLRANKHPLAP